VVDCFDAVREDRQYRKGLSRDKACQLLREGAGKQFDPEVVEAFLQNLNQYEEEIRTHKASQQSALFASSQRGLSESGRNAAPAAGLASDAPEYLKQINAAHVEVAALYEMAQTFSAGLDVRDVVTLMVNRLEKLTPFTTCVIYLRRSDDSVAADHVFGRNAERIRGRSLSAGRGIVGWVVVNGCAMSNTDPMLDLGHFLERNETGYRTAAVLPFAGPTCSIGALALYSSEMESYDSDQLQLLESVVRLTSNALQRALEYERNRASAQSDALTGLPNGRALYAHLDHELAVARERASGVTLLSFSLYGMRAVNEMYGYQTGDQVLVEVARQLQSVVSPRGFISRIAGIEFVCVLKDQSPAEAIRLGEKAQQQVRKLEVRVGAGQTARVGLSFGIAEYPVDGDNVNDLLQVSSAETRRNEQLCRKAGLLEVSPEAATLPYSN
jgi:diguanylate cyclase (GGDEF)-like protein